MAICTENTDDGFKYPFKFDEDEAVLARKCMEIDDLLSSGSDNFVETQKLHSRYIVTCLK